MAVLAMDKLSLCAMRRDTKRIMELLQRRGVVEVSNAGEEDEVFQKTDTTAVRGLFDKNADAAAQALEILGKMAPAKGEGMAFLKGRKPISVAEDAAFEQRRDDTLRSAQRIVQLQRAMAEANADIARAEAGLEALKPWMDLPVPQTFGGTKKTAAFVGVLEGERSLDSILAGMAKASPQLEAVHVEIIRADKTQTNILVLCLKKDVQACEDALRAIGFARPPGASHLMPAEKKRRLEQQKADAQKLIEDARAEIISHAERREDFKYLADNMQMRAERYEALEKTMISQHTLVLTGYVPAEDAEAIKAELEQGFDCDVQLQAAARPGGEVPVKLKNNRFTEPAEGVVESYSPPGVTDVDPTSVMAIFYYLMFGIMFGDAGYGLIMVVVCGLVLLRFKNMEPNWNKNVRMFFWCGVFTVFWGVIFGSYFGNVVDVVSATFFGRQVSIPPVWFYIEKEPMLMLVFSLGLGIVHLTAGFIMKGVTNMRNGDKIGVLYDTVFPIMVWYPLVVVLLGSEMFYNLAGFKLSLSPAANLVCLALSGIAIVGVLFTGGRESKRWHIRLMKGAYAVYNTVSGWLSDMMSYSRLMALGLASGVIGSVMNQLGSMFGGGIVGAIGFVIVFLAGHGMNFGINVLGAYVHSNRLEYIEFFGKFYEGGGRKFAPFGMHTKYYKIVEEDVSL